MRSAPIAAVCVLLSLAPILAGCGGDGTATAGGGEATTGERAATSAPRTATGDASAHASSPARRCGRRLGDFLDATESLANTLAVGLDFEGYLRSVNRVRAVYAGVEAERLPLACLVRVATPAERALNTYIDAANAWGECLAAPPCDAESVEPELQREWEAAADLLAGARDGLRGLG